MRFGVLTCPGCRRAQAVELRFRTVRCSACRRPLDLAGSAFHWRGDADAEARAVVMRLGAQRGGVGIEEYAQLLAELEAERPGDIEDALASLRSTGEFTAQEFTQELERRRVAGDPVRHLESLARDNRVYEPRPGRYRVV